LIAIVTQCFGPDFGGIETLMTGLADQLLREGERVEVFADRVRRAGAGELRRDYPIHRFGLWRPVRRHMKRRAIAAVAGRAPLRGVFTDSWKSVAAVPQGAGPIVVLAHGNEIPRERDGPKCDRVREALARAQVVVASSRFTADMARPLAPEGRVIVINPPIPSQVTAQPPALARLDAAIAGRSPVMSTLCRLEPRKGVDIVLRVLPRLRERLPNIVYLVGGSGGDLPRLQRVAAEAGVADRVVFLGALADDQAKAAFFERTDVFAMPTRRVANSVEGFGIVYAEAAWRGVPSLGGAEGGAADAVLDGKTGLLCRGDDEGEVFEALSRLLGDETMRRGMGAAARQHALKNLTWPTVLPHYLAALRGSHAE
jgi:phosphatidylinositol alpha-1,6-mannosyltransferase